MHCEIIHLVEADSTNLEAMRRWSGRPLVVVAERQTSGRGRQGRQWQSPAGGLWMTLAWPAASQPVVYTPASLAAGLATAEAIDAVSGERSQLKWPNDILLASHKVAGLLCELDVAAKPPLLLVGVGINANLAREALGGGLRQPATTLREQLGHDVDLTVLRDTLVDRLVVRLRALEESGFTPLSHDYLARLAWVGERVSCTSHGEIVEGILEGVAEDGALLLKLQGGAVRRLLSGDLDGLRRHVP